MQFYFILKNIYLLYGIIYLEEADNPKMMVGVMRPDEHLYANYDADPYFENTIVPVGESSPQNKMMDEKGDQNP